jgi:prepilin-type N-terminal cleavage/methylation domain-containing protein
MLRRRWNTNPTPDHRQDDSGLTLIEVIVAMALFLILSTASMSILLVSLKTTEVNRDRVGAANLAGRELEIVRNQFTGLTRGPDKVTLNQAINENPLTGAVCLGSACPPIVLDNVRYTVTRTVQWSAVGETAASTCDNGTSSELAYLRVNVSVSWDRMTGNPISMDTVLTPPKGTYSTSTGHLGLKIVDEQGHPGAGHTVTITGASGTDTGVSAADGCTVFAFLTPGPYTVSVDEHPFVNLKGEQHATLSVSVLIGQMAHSTLDYGVSATINAAFVTLTGYNLPDTNDIPLTLGNSGLLPSGSTPKAGSRNDIQQTVLGVMKSNRTVADLWPFTSGYQLWAGGCLDADPKATGQTRADAVASQSGGLTGAQVDLAPLDVSGAVSGAIINAVHAPDTACPAGGNIKLGVANAAGTLKTSLPYGNWKITDGVHKALPTLKRGDATVQTAPLTLALP